jgi:ABC-type glycerol-3-phosphate transport system permease component
VGTRLRLFTLSDQAVTFLLAWNEFIFAVVLIESWENRVLTMAIYSLVAEFVTIGTPC